MEEQLQRVLPNYKNVEVVVIPGITHTNIRIFGESKAGFDDFISDIFIYHRTQEISIARLNIKKESLLTTLLDVVSTYTFLPLNNSN